jgi:hypothetical protein
MSSESTVLGIPAADTPGDSWAAAAIAVAGFILILGILLMVRLSTDALGHRVPATAVSAARPNVATDPQRYMLNALFVPALEADAVPLRWVDPMPAMHCTRGSWVKVDRHSLQPGALVPDAPFLLDWELHHCFPFGTSGPRFDGHVRLTVFREDWGFSAMVEPYGLRTTLEDGRAIAVAVHSVTMPQALDEGAPPTLYAARIEP